MCNPQVLQQPKKKAPVRSVMGALGQPDRVINSAGKQKLGS